MRGQHYDEGMMIKNTPKLSHDLLIMGSGIMGLIIEELTHEVRGLGIGKVMPGSTNRSHAGSQGARMRNRSSQVKPGFDQQPNGGCSTQNTKEMK